MVICDGRVSIPVLQTILDTNVVIDIIEAPSRAQKMRAGIRGKQVRFVVCDTVLRELRRVRRWSADAVLAGLEKVLGRSRVVVSDPPEGLVPYAAELRRRYEMAHNGDVHILAQCRIAGCALLTRDGKMRQVASMVGVLAFHPEHVDKM